METETTGAWLNRQLECPTDVPELIDSIQKKPFVANWEENQKEYRLSLSQRCELHEQRRVFKIMNRKEQLHLQASMGASQVWVNVLPLKWKNWNLEPSEWLVSTRRRLFLDVRPNEGRCPSCSWHVIDKKGEHAITCHGAYSTSLRLHAIRDLIGQACRQAGYEVVFEDSGGLSDGRRPGDVSVRRWKSGKDLLIDCAVVHPTTESHYPLWTRRSGNWI